MERNLPISARAPARPAIAFFLLIISAAFFLLPSLVSAAPVSNFRDPGPGSESWSFSANPSCSSAGPNPLWTFDTSGIPENLLCAANSPAVQKWQQAGSGYKVNLILDNTVNPSLCSEERIFFALKPDPGRGVKNNLFLKDLTSLHLKLTVGNGTGTMACDDETNTECQAHACQAPESKIYGDVALVAGIPLLDETSGKTFTLEISPFWTNNAVFGGPQDDPNSQYYLFWAGNQTGELARLMVTHPLVSQPAASAGKTISYDFDILPLLKSVPWGTAGAGTVDPNSLRVSGAYAGAESFGWSKADFSVSGFDLVYDSARTPSLCSPPGNIDCQGTVDIFDYNIMLFNLNKSGADPRTDLNGDGRTDIFDLNLLFANLGK